jgi:NAD(P)-dependent dehydrogenase (short-subunit alcohol dehydrogenase family)
VLVPVNLLIRPLAALPVESSPAVVPRRAYVESMDTRVAVLTQTGDYVGPELARRLAGTHHLVLHDPADDLVDELRSDGCEVEVVTGADADLRGAAGNQVLVERALARFGRIDAAAVVTGTGIITGRFLDITEKQWERTKTGNLDMAFYALQALIPPMVAQGSGDIVVFTSATGARPEPGVSTYSATRAGANALVRATGQEFAKLGLCINAIGTNFMDFPGFLAASGAGSDPERRTRIEAQTPARRLGTMEELAEFTAVLLEGKTRFQTGQFFSFSGGWSG